MQDTGESRILLQVITLPFTPRMLMSLVFSAPFGVLLLLLVPVVPLLFGLVGGFSTFQDTLNFVMDYYWFLEVPGACVIVLGWARYGRILARGRTRPLPGLGLTLAEVRREIKKSSGRRVRRNSFASMLAPMLVGACAVFSVLAVVVAIAANGVRLGAWGTIIGTLLGIFLVRLHQEQKRRNAPHIDALAKKMPGEFILYLRSFKDDGALAKIFDGGFNVQSFGYLPSNFEGIVLGSLSKRLVVAIASPREPLPPRFANAIYVDARSWQERAAEYMQNAQCIVVMLGDGMGVDWDVRTIFERGHTAKTLFVLPPAEIQVRALRWEHFRSLAQDQLWNPFLDLLDPALLLTLQVTRTGTLVPIVGPFYELGAYDEAICVGAVIINRGDLPPDP